MARQAQKGELSSSARALLVFVPLALAHCTLALRRERDQCKTSADCQSLAVGTVCTTDGVCETLQTASQPGDCQSDSDCPDPWAVCRRPPKGQVSTNGDVDAGLSGRCYSLTQTGCHRVGTADTADHRERLPMVVLLPEAELDGSGPPTNLQAMTLAIDELNRVGAPVTALPRLAAVACSEASPAVLGDLLSLGEVHLVLGPTKADAVTAVSNEVDGRAVIFAPFADAPALALPQQSPPVSTLVSCKPNNVDAPAPLLSAVEFIRARFLESAEGTTVLAVSEVEHGLGYDRLFNAADLTAAGIRSISYNSDPTGMGLTDALLALRPNPTPDLLVSSSAEADWRGNIGAVERQRSVGNYPFYLLSYLQADVLDLVTNDALASPPLDQRLFWLDNQLNERNLSAHEQLRAALDGSSGVGFSAGLDYVYDCAYLATYAALAGQLRFALSPKELSPTAIIVGLRALSGQGPELSVGAHDIPSVVTALETGRAVGSAGRPHASPAADASLVLLGGSGNLNLKGNLPVESVERDATGMYLRPLPSAKELYCVDAPHRRPCDTGLSFAVSGGPPSGPERQCSCFPTR